MMVAIIQSEPQMKKLLCFLTMFLFVSLMVTTTDAMTDQKGAQKIPTIQATGPYALFCEIHTLLQQHYSPKSIVVALKQQKINVHAYENDPRSMYIGWTALHIAVFQQPDRTRISIVQILIDAGADVNARIKPQHKLHGFTPLHTTLYAGFFEYAPILIRAHADVNARINNPGNYRHGWRPLDIAARQYMAVRFLVAHGSYTGGTLCKTKSSQLYQDLKPKILEAMIHGKMDISIARARERIKLTALFNEL